MAVLDDSRAALQIGGRTATDPQHPSQVRYYRTHAAKVMVAGRSFCIHPGGGVNPAQMRNQEGYRSRGVHWIQYGTAKSAAAGLLGAASRLGGGVGPRMWGSARTRVDARVAVRSTGGPKRVSGRVWARGRARDEY